MRSPIKWFGGKGLLTKKLLNYVPKHKYYLEVFGGAASLLFAKEPSDFEVYNDINDGLFNFWKVLHNKETFNEFYEKAIFTYYSKSVYEYAKENWNKTNDEIEKAYLWWIVARMNFSGDIKSGWGFTITNSHNHMTQRNSALLSIIDKLPEIHKRIQRVQIDKKDWLKCLETYTVNTKWNYENSFIYLDPPYVKSTRKSGEYDHELTEEDHKKLIKYLIENKKQNKFMLSGYDNEIYKELEKNGWKKICWDVACYAAGRTKINGIQGEGITFTKKQRRTECIWINY